MKMDSKLFVATDKSYMVFMDCMIEGELASYLLYTEGNGRSLLRLFREHRNELSSNIYYIMKDAKIFKNHSELVTTQDGEKLYKLKGDNKCL